MRRCSSGSETSSDDATSKSRLTVFVNGSSAPRQISSTPPEIWTSASAPPLTWRKMASSCSKSPRACAACFVSRSKKRSVPTMVFGIGSGGPAKSLCGAPRSAHASRISSVSSIATAMKRRVYAVRSAGERRRACPQSSTASRPVAVSTRRLPGWGSQLKISPCMVSEKASTSAVTIRVTSSSLAPRRRTSLMFSPSTYSMPSTRLVASAGNTSGTKTAPPSSDAASSSRAVAWLCASIRKSSSARVRTDKSLTTTRMSWNKCGKANEASSATICDAPMSISSERSTCRCCTLTTPSTSSTRPPSRTTRSRARCTCAMVAEPSGGPSYSLTDERHSGPSSASSSRCTEGKSSAGIASCSCASSSLYTSGSADETEVACASLTQKPPSDATVSYTKRALTRWVISQRASAAAALRPRTASDAHPTRHDTTAHSHTMR
mmetsp:Transcript_46429/g.152038  ORF Transcript_46429/g.152038 Transcript_46429/m.152038 type:complete len:436 (-) Transcript_46429:35-1342(-)